MGQDTRDARGSLFLLPAGHRKKNSVWVGATQEVKSSMLGGAGQGNSQPWGIFRVGRGGAGQKNDSSPLERA